MRRMQLRRASDSAAAAAAGDARPMLPQAWCSPACMFVSMAAMGLYNSRQRSRLAGLLARVAASVLGGAMVIAVIFYLLPALHIERGALLLSLAGRVRRRRWSCASCSTRIVDEDVFKRRVLVYGAGSARGEHRAAAPPLGPPRLPRRRLRARPRATSSRTLRDNEKLLRSDMDLLTLVPRSIASTRSWSPWTIGAAAFRWISCSSAASKASRSSSW